MAAFLLRELRWGRKEKQKAKNKNNKKKNQRVNNKMTKDIL